MISRVLRVHRIPGPLLTQIQVSLCQAYLLFFLSSVFAIKKQIYSGCIGPITFTDIAHVICLLVIGINLLEFHNKCCWQRVSLFILAVDSSAERRSTRTV